MGLLKVNGTVNLSQFWPHGDSDADTTKVILSTSVDAFEFQPHPGTPFAVTHAFDDAKVIGAGSKQVIDNKGRITIRLQGIDAPELHYRPAPIPKKLNPTGEQQSVFKELNKEYRQHFGETATVKLYELLSKAGNGELACTVTTAVNSPNDVFDTYGRFIGDLIVEQDSAEINVNHWLVKEGLAFPTFYTSMSPEEIEAYIDAAKQGRQKKKSIWTNLQTNLGKFDRTLVYRGKNAKPAPTEDTGSLLFPKLFRRFCTWSIYRKAEIVSSTFQRYLKDKRDACYLTEEFLEHGLASSNPHFLDEFVKSKEKIDFLPEQLVFNEGQSKLVNATTGKPITEW
jgi:endonuclease YncB( thermonuclease family)